MNYSRSSTARRHLVMSYILCKYILVPYPHLYVQIMYYMYILSVQYVRVTDDGCSVCRRSRILFVKLNQLFNFTIYSTSHERYFKETIR